MSAATNPPVSFVAPGSTAHAAATLRGAIRRLQSLATIALGVSFLVLIESYLSWSGVYRNLPQPGAPFDISWQWGVQLGIGVAIGVAIAVLVVVALVIAVLGLVGWRRGVLGLVAAAPEFGPAHVAACAQARRDHSRTLWLFLGLVIVAIVVAAAFAGVNGSLALIGAATVPSTLGNIATGLATGGVLVGIYYYGSRHLVGVLSAVASQAESTLLERGRTRMLVGAVIGLGAAFASVSWAFGVFAIVSLAWIVPGVRDLVRAYDLWLAEHGAAAAPTAAVGLPAA